MLDFLTTVKVPPVAVTPPREVGWREARRLGKVRKAFLVRDVVYGEAKLDALTAEQMAKLLGVSMTYVRAALRASFAERVSIMTGQRPLVSATAGTLEKAWASADAGAKAAFVQVRGDEILNAI
jgi:hypothetical protein